MQLIFIVIGYIFGMFLAFGIIVAVKWISHKKWCKQEKEAWKRIQEHPDKPIMNEPTIHLECVKNEVF